MSGQIETFNEGQVIFLQGNSYAYFYYIHSGEIEILSAQNEFEGLDESLILSHSKRVAHFAEKTFVVPMDDITVRAVTACNVERIQPPSSGIAGFFKSQPGKGIMLLAYLFRQAEYAYHNHQKFGKLFVTLSKLLDNLLILFKSASGREVNNRLTEPIQEVYNAFVENAGTVPEKVKASFLFADHSATLNKHYTGEKSFSHFIDKNLYHFLKRFLKLNKTVFAHVINGDPHIPQFIEQNIATLIHSIYKEIFNQQNKSYELMDYIFGNQESVTSLLVDEGAINDFLAAGKLADSFFNDFITHCEKLYTMYKEYTGKNAFTQFPGLENLKKYVHTSLGSTTQSEETDTQSSEKVSTVSGSMQMYSNSLQQIFNFANVDGEFKHQLLQSLNQFKKLPIPFTTDNDGRKIRRTISTQYWKLYEKVFIQSKKSKSIPPPVKLMLMYGYLDENLVESDQIPVLHRYAADKYKPAIPILFEYEFLTRIYKEQEETSVNEMGLTFDKLLREKARATRNPEEILKKLENPDEKIIYEIENRLSSTASVTSGSRSTAFPILTSQLVQGDPAGFLVTKTKLESVFNEIHKIDYSLFYRETVFKIEESREIIEEEILPFVIILPTYGTKTMMWQEITGTNKRSRARLVIPSFFTGDLKKELMHAFAIFRWELNRSLKGGLWADPVEGGITGAYSDYIQFFKKNSRLSPEAKQKIAEKFRSARNNVREMFADDYILWLTYEKEGIMKLNSVVRDIMYRYIPFPSEIRENLERMPAFSDSATRFKNIRNRTFAAFERKFRKYKNEDETYPAEIEKYLKYLRM
jgi:hypothetical protein